MNLQQIFDENKQIKSLYDYVNTHYPVELKKAENNNGVWSAGIQLIEEKYFANIFWCPTKHPQAALVHELLHIKNQILGFRKIRVGITIKKESDNKKILCDVIDDSLKKVCEIVDNELQHHKMYSEFISLGFRPEQFYSNDDIEAEKHLTKYLQLKLNDTNFIGIAIQYLSLIAPGGYIFDKKKQELKIEFRKLNNREFVKNFDEIDSLINDYINDNSYNAEPYIKRFINNLDYKYKRVWLGYSSDMKDFPKGGFFVDEEFGNNFKLV